MEYIFRTETIHDLALHKEFNRGYLRAGFVRNLLVIPLCLAMLSLTTQFDTPFMVYYFLLFSAVMLVVYLMQNRKGGDIHYKRMLQMNNGEPPHLIIDICADGIHCTHRTNGNKNELRYDMFRSIIDTPNLLIMVMQHRQCLILEKRWLQGGTVQELSDFLLNNCPNIKRKRLRKTTFGKWMRRVAVVCFVITFIFAIASLTGVSLWDRLTGKLHNDVSYREMAAELAPLGITISDQTISELEEYERDYAAENGTDFYDENTSASKVLDLLYWEGSGVYDETTFDWTPSTSGIFWFDTEVMNVDSIYTDFFAGISAMNPELDFTNVREDYSEANLDSGTGTVAVSFDYNGQHYDLDAIYYGDWFDVQFLHEVGAILREDNSANDLYYTNDGQGILLYYSNQRLVHQLERMTGLAFDSADGSFSFF